MNSNSNNDKNRFDDLLIFGYACKLFRDDETALQIESTRLIPWMGDNSLKIDRYDVRAALTDISQYEPPPGGYDNRLDYLSSAEQKAEQLCEEERYFSLYNDDIQEELYKEEDLKRSKTRGYGQIGFSYDQVSTSNDSPDGSKKDEDENKDELPDEVYIPNSKFFLPPNMVLPETTKLHTIIEKTAKFISTQGAQMEILMKAKQANNPLFEFLSVSSRLNPFYKHTLQAMKDGNYPADGGQASSTEPSNTNESSSSIFQSYYNPLANQPKIHVPVVKYKPSADCAYTQLISKIKGVPILTETSSGERSGTSSPNPQSPKPSTNTTKGNDVEIKKISSGLMLAQYYNSDTDEDSDNENSSNGVASNVKSIQKPTENTQTTSNSTNSRTQTPTVSATEDPIPPGILCPPPELRVMIDKTAAYVLKNGKDFEDILRSKNDERFTFLQYKNQYHKYYKYKVTGIVCPEPIPVTIPPVESGRSSTKDHGFSGSSLKNHEINKQIGPVSFTIKSKDESTSSVNLKPALPLEHSSDDDDEKQKNENKEPKTANPNQYMLAQDLPLPPDFHQQNSLYLQTSTTCSPLPQKKANISLNSSNREVEQSDSFIRDTILEQQNLQEKKEAKRAEEKVKDRLAQIAREKLGILSKEKQLQLERKRRAMAFLNQIGPAPNENSETPAEKTKTDSLMKINGNDSENDSDSGESVTFVSATPSTSLAAALSQTQTTRRQRNLRTKRGSRNSDEDSDDVVEVVSRNSYSRSRSRSTSSSSRRHRHKSKRSKKKSHKRRSRSRSRSRSPSRFNRYSRSSSHEYKRKKRSSSRSKSKRRKRYSDD